SAGRFQLDRFKPAGGRQVLPPARFARLRLLCHSELAGACPEWAGSLGEDTKGGANRECRRDDSRWGDENLPAVAESSRRGRGPALSGWGQAGWKRRKFPVPCSLFLVPCSLF